MIARRMRALFLVALCLQTAGSYSIGSSHASLRRARPPQLNVNIRPEQLGSVLEQRRTQLLSELADLTRAIEAEEADQAERTEFFMGVNVTLGSGKSTFEPSFGYLSRSAGVYTESETADGTNLPSNAIDLAVRNFGRELPELLKTLNGTDRVVCGPNNRCSDEAAALRSKLDALVLSNDAVWQREKDREEAGGGVSAPLVLLVPYYVLCFALDVCFEDRPLSRFWFLETVARMPYFSYVSMLHLYESLGWWRRSAETKRVHFAEEWNEFHHLLTMEALGGDQLWIDRFLAQHAAIAYYWILVILWLLSPTLAYNFSELIEAHAVDTYGEFVDANREALAELPAPRVTRLYYNGPDLFLFDEFQTARPRGSRRPQCESLLDVFTNIRDDEAEHVATMKQCQDPNVKVVAPKIEAALIAVTVAGIAYSVLTPGDDPANILDAATDVSESISSGALDAELLTGAAAAASGYAGQIAKAFEEVGTGVRELFDLDLKRVVDEWLKRFFEE